MYILKAAAKSFFFLGLLWTFAASRHDLNPIVVWIQDESNMSHLSVARLLLEFDAKAFEAIASFLDIVHAYSDMSKSSARVRVSVGIAFEIRILFGSQIVRQFKNAFASKSTLRFFFGGFRTALVVVTEEIESKRFSFVLVEQFHP